MTSEVTNIIRDLVNQIDNSMLGVYEPSTGRTLICNTKWSRVGKTISNEAGEVYTITEVQEDEYIIAVPELDTSPDLDGLIYLSAPFYISGTKMATNREWTIST